MGENNVMNKQVVCKSLFFVLGLLFNVLILNAQALKTYSGKYKSGTATYTYKDNPEGGRIYEGDFVYIRNNGMGKVTGKFKNDRKEGKWTYTNKSSLMSMPVLKATYKNGMLDGPYQYTSKDDCISLTISNGKFMGDVNGSNLSFCYKKGISNYIVTLESLKGQFDENGYCDGKWTLQQNEVVRFYGLYEHGVCKKFCREDLTTGDIENVEGDITYMLNMIIEDNYKNLESMIERNNVEWKWWSVEREESQTVEKEEEQTVFSVVDEMPEFPNGDGALINYLQEHVNYPIAARENRIQGRVIVSFIVNEDGSISDVKVKKSVDPDLDKEAVRVVQSMPNWKPGRNDEKNVRVNYTVPVTFRL